MLTPDQIPDSVVEAALKKRGLMREALADALNAWPGFEYKADVAFPAFGYGSAAIILPLPQQEGSE